jgi:uncharacterized protein
MHINFLFFAFLAFLSINIYLFVRGWQALPANSVIYSLYTGIFLIVSIAFFWAFFLRESFSIKPGNVLKLIGGYWIIFSIYFLLAAFFADFLRVLNYFFHIFPPWITSNYSQVKLIYFSTVLLSLFLVSWFGYKRFANPEITELNLSINKDKADFEDLKIVAASDIHLGYIVRNNRLSEWVDMINKQHPDVILIVGDLFDRRFDFAESANCEEILRKLKSKYGVYAVLGNHEYYGDLDKSILSIERSGIHLLRDQAVTIDNKFVMAGRDDATNSKRKIVKLIIAGVDPSLPVILMDHQPSNLHESVANKIDFHISGHLHNGQIFPFNLVLSTFWELTYGYRKIGDTHFYVSSGLGLRIAPIRFGTHSEIVRILLKAKSDSSTTGK